MSKWDLFIDGLYLVGFLMALGIAVDFMHGWYKKLTGSYRNQRRRWPAGRLGEPSPKCKRFGDERF